MKPLSASRAAPAWLALVLGLGLTEVGCDKLGLGHKEDSHAKKDDDDDEDDGKKKKKKRDDEGDKKQDKSDDEGSGPKSGASASASASATPSSASSGVADESTGIPECDEYVKMFAKCIPGGSDGAKKLRDGLKTGAQYGHDQILKTCKDGIEGLKGACAGK